MCIYNVILIFHQRENCDMWTHTIRPNEKVEYVYDIMWAEVGRMMSHSLYIQTFLQWAACFNLWKQHFVRALKIYKDIKMTHMSSGKNTVKLGIVAYAYTLNTWEVEKGGSPQLQRKFILFWAALESVFYKVKSS